jgi:hypothetical protein
VNVKRRYTPRKARRELRKVYDRLYDAVLTALNDADLMRLLEMGAPEDEYELVTGTILPRLKHAACINDVAVIIDEEFRRWFSNGESGNPEACQEPAERIWRHIEETRRPTGASS